MSACLKSRMDFSAWLAVIRLFYQQDLPESNRGIKNAVLSFPGG
ncbi:hypothetical protein FDUTEX481_05217 [Tolypothrix sp. PCC 7601]|nr:hypothetical protein FDUTEX481_05217 [Tolypothrix sp. PCC 7601]